MSPSINTAELSTDQKDLESAKQTTEEPGTPVQRRLFQPSFPDAPPFSEMLQCSWPGILTQLLCALAALLIYLFATPLLPRHLPLYAGLHTSPWGLRHGKPFLAEYINTAVSAAVSFVVPLLIIGAMGLWMTRRFWGTHAAVSLTHPFNPCSNTIQTTAIIGYNEHALMLRLRQLMGLGYALATATLFQALIKWIVGGLRPHFLSLCEPHIPLHLSGIDPQGIWYRPRDVCTGDEKKLREAQMSFPSGHACAAFAGFGFLSLYLNSTLGIFEHEQGLERRGGSHWKLMVFVAPLLAALLIAASKVSDGWHHPVDVVAGALIGCTFAIMAFKMVAHGVQNGRP